MNKTDTNNRDIASSFRRWGYLQAELDVFRRIPAVAHEELDTVSGPEAEQYRSIYCGPIGLEFLHMHYADRCRWLAERMETAQESQTIDHQHVFRRILEAELFEKFVHTRYVGAKRFSLEGSAGVIPLLDTIISRAANQGFEQVLIGMSHRGRLTTMHLIANLPAAKIFASFEDIGAREILGSGDVKYHRGCTGIYTSPEGKSIVVRMASNPSHLEATNPVILGRVRGEQERQGDTEKHEKVLSIILHGDAAFAGQGIAAESLNYAELEGFSVGGTINIVINNLIGFTALPKSLNSSLFATDIAKRLPIPIWHVNAEEPDAVVRAGLMAMDYRKTFNSEVVIDLIGFRRFGHNEADDPTVTSPELYARIAKHPLLYQSYAKRIGIPQEQVRAEEQLLMQRLDDELKVGRGMTALPIYFRVADYWLPYVGGPYEPSLEVETSLTAERIHQIAERISFTPEGFSVHPKIKKVLEDRMKMGTGEKPFDWGGAEAMAIGSLLWDGTPVRIVGQDSCRGTFNHRQAVLYDYRNGNPFIPLKQIHPSQAKFDVYDSMLSEAAALGFEYGYSRQFPEALVCWEAQFGDFVNGAQIIIDQFLTAGEDKWGLLSGLVLLLPHGFEGMGPEHSSARVERFLQLAAEDNIQVCQPSNAAQYFHLLRRQVLRKWRKPLVVFTPKSMLRLPAASSPLLKLTSDRFHPVLDDEPGYENAERLIFCTGKIAHELRRERSQIIGSTNSGGSAGRLAIITIEQLYPFADLEFKKVIAKYPLATQATWVQEEPANMGALFYIRPILENYFGHKHFTTVKRSASASPATGSAKAHSMEQSVLIKMTLN